MAYYFVIAMIARFNGARAITIQPKKDDLKKNGSLPFLSISLGDRIKSKLIITTNQHFQTN